MTTQAELKADLAVIRAEAAFEISESAALAWRHDVLKLAHILHRSYLRRCNGPEITPGSVAARREVDTEAALRSAFDRLGLGLYLQSDPRGNPVGILTPTTGRYNTMGDAECGWRL